MRYVRVEYRSLMILMARSRGSVDASQRLDSGFLGLPRIALLRQFISRRRCPFRRRLAAVGGFASPAAAISASWSPANAAGPAYHWVLPLLLILAPARFRLRISVVVIAPLKRDTARTAILATASRSRPSAPRRPSPRAHSTSRKLGCCAFHGNFCYFHFINNGRRTHPADVCARSTSLDLNRRIAVELSPCFDAAPRGFVALLFEFALSPALSRDIAAGADSQDYAYL